MEKSVEQWLEQRKQEENNLKKKERNRLLILNGLFHLEEITVEEYSRGIVDGNPIEYLRKENNNSLDIKYYKRIPVELTDEEYKEVSKYFREKDRNKKRYDSRAGEKIKDYSLAWLILVIIATVIASITWAVILKSFALFLEIFIPGLFVAFFVYAFLNGFGHIVSDVKDIKNRLARLEEDKKE